MALSSVWMAHLVFALLVQLSCSWNQSPRNQRTSVFVNGQFIVGALFPLHHQPSSKKNFSASMDIKCGDIRELYGIQRVEAMLQTLDAINSDPDLLPNITLGAEIRDECWYAPLALQQSIELIRDSITPASTAKFCRGDEEDKAKGPLVAIIGPGSSSVALQVQNLLQLFHIPQIGYSTTSRDLSDKNRFNYFLRVVPSDYYQAQVMLDIVRSFGWSYVSAVNTDENYGQSGIQAFRELAEEADVCIAREDSVLSNAADEVFDKVVINLKQDPNAVVVVCFCEGLTVRGLLRAIKRLNMTNYFLLIGSDGWADRNDVTRHYEEQAWGGLSIRIHSPYVDSFDKYYWSLKPETNLRNPWFKEFWQTKFQCVLKSLEDQRPFLSTLDYSALQVAAEGDSDGKSPFCTGQETLKANYKQDPKLSFVIKAIYSLAHALHDMVRALCAPNSGLCAKMLPFNGSLLKSHLMNVSFDFNGETFQFDDNGDPPGRYDIMNYQKLPDGTFEYVQVAGWNNRSLIWTQSPQFPEIRSRKVVQSVCADECPKGYYKNIQQGGKDKRCCWVCVPCPHGEILSAAGDKCENCPKGFAADPNRTACQLLQVEFVHWSDRSAVVVMVFSSLGLLTTVFALIVFIKHNNTPVVKSSTKELCYLILAGMTVAHVSTSAMLAKPSRVSCAATRLLPGLAFAMIYSALLTKTNRIARILAGSKRSFPSRKLLFMSATAHVMMALTLIALEAFISAAMLYVQPPAIAFLYLPSMTLLECDISMEAIVIPLSFDFFLILLCTVYAVKTRNVPENFNEAKFIGFAMYTTCVIWIAFVPIYFGSGAKTITMCMCVTLSALVTWVFLFVPKLYIILLQPEKNNRAFFTTAKIRCHIGSKVADMATMDKCSSNSWRESSISVTTTEPDKSSNNIPKRTMSSQTGLDLLELLLHPKRLMGDLAKGPLCVKIVEKDCCCDEPECQLKHITITLPDNC